MGHERLGTLPKTQRWKQIVQRIGQFSVSDDDVSHIVRQTIRNVESRLRTIQRDQGVQAAFKSLVIISFASQLDNPREVLKSNGIEVPDNPTPSSIAKGISQLVFTHRGSMEYTQIAQSAAIDTIAIWYEKHKESQASLFQSSPEPFGVWRKASNGAGFCELARLFFAKFTERYLNYFLEREASACLPDIHKRELFSKNIQEHVDDISKHAFETARITQSFAAGWFNNQLGKGVPTDYAIEEFLRLAFGKIREELQREANDR